MSAHKWKLEISICARSQQHLVASAAAVLRDITTKRMRDWPTMHWNGDGSSISVSYQSPTEHRIKELRREADELEASLANAPAGSTE